MRARGLRLRGARCTSGDSELSDVAFRSGARRRRPDLNTFSKLHTRPACAPVNASPVSLRIPAHDSGSVWLATAFTVRLFHSRFLTSYWRFRSSVYFSFDRG